MRPHLPLLQESAFNSVLSFRPLVEALKRNINEGNPGMQKLYGEVVKAFEAHPELLEPISDLSILFKYTELIEELLSAVFPPTTANFMYGVSVPFKRVAVYGSPTFKANLVKTGTNDIILPENHVGESLSDQRVRAAYDIILEKYYHLTGPGTYNSVYPYPDEASGLTRYMELRLDRRFITVSPVGELPELPKSLMDQHTNRMLKLEDLVHHIPIDQFRFEGLVVMRINDVTEQAVVTEIKNKLLHFDAFGNGTSDFIELEQYVQSLIRIKDLGIGLTPFFRINGHYIYSDLHNTNSILFRHLHSIPEKDEISDYCKLLFRDSDQPLLFETISEQALADFQCLQYYHREGVRSLLICPLKLGHELIGMLEITSDKPGQLMPAFISKVESVMPLFTLGLEKSLDQLNYEVDKVIKKKFTAVQPSVEWKFTEVALDFIVHQHEKENSKIKRICFDEVWPLYAALDIRNSSTERSQAIQRDVLEQLNLAKAVVDKAISSLSFPLLQELAFKINKFIMAASDVLQSEEEMSINDFMKTQVQSVFHHLRSTEHSLKTEIDHYFSTLDPQTGMLYKHRKDYESSVTKINETLSRIIDKEQLSAQKVYPHYFERFVTDGLEFNIYIGQAIAPRKKFDEIYLQNMKMWQLTVLAKAARVTHQLEDELSHKLRTTQLILSYSQQLSVTFRTEERKFDVDGTYNIRYEIVKKRIDKVRIRDTNERLTQPGKIAIVYSQAKDAAEYTEYIEFLQSQGLLKPGIEKYDLEELQGVSGLKALRVDVNFEEKPAMSPALELSQTTTDQLLGKS
ncbi:MAG: hypothetical protein IPP99_09045 [Chitinophagaceae bacterium]|nr:hypothetical protein [Chitinophagaceae bacterium]